MYDDHAFIQQVRENPHDTARRLIYADWLEEQGEPQGELIRVQCELAATGGGERWRRLAEREAELLDRYAETWLAPLRRLGAIGVSRSCFHGGLIEKVKLDAADFLTHGVELCRIAPALSCVTLKNLEPHLSELTRLAIPPQITRLELSANRLDPGGMNQLRLAPWIGQIVALDLKFNQLADAGVAQLCARNWPALKELDLSQNQIGPDGAAALARWEDLAQVRKLNLSGNRVGNLGVTALAAAFSARAAMEELDLASNQIGKEGAAALAKNQRLASLRRLSLRANHLDPNSISLIRFALGEVADLDVRSNTPPYR